jgi:predicted nucleotidyltransferase
VSAASDAAEVVARRQSERDRLLREAQAFADRLDPALGIRWVAVFGSVARGDFNAYSDIDVLVVADRLPADYRQRLAALDWPSAERVEPVAWTVAEFARQLSRGNPVAVEAVELSVSLAGEPPPV